MLPIRRRCRIHIRGLAAMPPSADADTEQLLQRAERGDQRATSELLLRHQDRLKRMVSYRMDPRLARRVDPSDVVQEALADAAAKLPTYLRSCAVPFYPWLRSLAWERLVQAHRRHIRSEKRSVAREQPYDMLLPDNSAMLLAERLTAPGTSPSAQLLRSEMRRRVQDRLSQLKAVDRELIILRYVEQMSSSEIAAVLDTTEAAIKMRHLRALRQLRELLGDDFREGLP